MEPYCELVDEELLRCNTEMINNDGKNEAIFINNWFVSNHPSDGKLLSKS